MQLILGGFIEQDTFFPKDIRPLSSVSAITFKNDFKTFITFTDGSIWVVLDEIINVTKKVFNASVDAQIEINEIIIPHL